MMSLGRIILINCYTYNADPLFPIKGELSSLHRIDNSLCLVS
jgi:hypothetical protein